VRATRSDFTQSNLADETKLMNAGAICSSEAKALAHVRTARPHPRRAFLRLTDQEESK
jgi:hypothetical protein